MNINITGTLYWPFLHKKDPMYDMYKVTIGNLSDEAVARLKEIGVKVTKSDDKPEQGYYVTAKNRREPIKTQNQDRQDLGTDVLVANGSKGVVSCFVAENTKYPTKGLIANSIMVTELVEYNPDEQVENNKVDSDQFEDIA